MACFFDIVRLQVFPDAKDISESYGALSAACRHCGIGKDAEKASGVLCLAVGDGSTPRTAGLAAFLTKWTCVSIDPVLRPEWTGKHPKEVRSLFGYAGTLEDWVPDQLSDIAKIAGGDNGVQHLMVLCVHSHNRFLGSASLDHIRSCLDYPPTTLVSLPCCHLSNPQGDLGRFADVSFEDLAIFSMCRTVNIWVWGKGPNLVDCAGDLAKTVELPAECKQKPRLCESLASWQAKHQQQSEESRESNEDQLDAIGKVKLFQKQSKEKNQQWCTYADDHLGGVKDPAKHTDEDLYKFLDWIKNLT